MTDTAQGASPAETEVSDPILAAANAFKSAVPELVPAERPRDEHGRFVSNGPQEIEAEEEEADVADPEAAESHDEAETDEAAEEAQPEPVDLPTSWPSDMAETWNSLPAETQAFITQREAERDAAVNAKFQEAANVRKANEAVIIEADTNRQKFAEAADLVLGLLQPQRPSTSMLNPASPDYNPDAYHLQIAQAAETEQLVNAVKQQREQALAQLQTEAEQRAQQALEEIEAKSRPALLKDVPELADPAKQGAAIQSLVQYAVAQGIPEYVFTDPEIARGVTSAQIHLTWKAQQYDKMIAAKAKVQPKAARPAAPPVRPGVATSASAVKNAERKKVIERLDREGSVEAGAAVFKNMFKGI